MCRCSGVRAQQSRYCTGGHPALTVPNQLGVDHNAHVIESILTDVAPALAWR